MTDVCPEDPSNPPWDPLREQDWASLGVVVDAMDPEDTMAHWESLAGTGAVASHAANSTELSLDDDELSLGGSLGKRKVCMEFSPVAVDTMVDCLENNSSWPFGSSGGKDVNGRGQVVKQEGGGLLGRGHSEDSILGEPHMGLDDGDDAEMGLPFRLTPGEAKPAAPVKNEVGLGRTGARTKLSLAIPGDGKAGEPQLVEAEAGSPAANAAAGAGPEGEKTLFPVHLFVTAIADGKIINDTSPKMYAVLEQVRRKVSKEQNTVVQVCNEGAVDLKMRVFVANSVEAKAVGDYISSHPTQVPAPFVVLAKQLLMAVSYDAAALNPSHASVADRLRKQIKTHAVKVLREAIGDKKCNLCTAMLRGFSGPMAPAKIIEPLVAERTQAVACYPGKRYIVLPAKNKAARDDRAPSSNNSSANNSPRGGARGGFAAAGASSPALTPAPGPNLWPSVQLPVTPRSPDSPRSAPSTPGTAQEELDAVWEGRLSAHFPVNLFVTAIADGDMARDTPAKVQERLSQIVRKVPKEQNTSVEVAEGATIDLKMRVFVVNSEDAKAVGEYIKAHLEQLPAPFVVLARHLPMAVLYDPATLDLSDASVADRLRKQAKTRAVKVLREAIGNKQMGITQHMLRGHCGAMQPAECLADFLASRTQPLDGDPKNKCVVFAARNKGCCSVPCSPRKRPADSPPPLHDPHTDPSSPLSADGSPAPIPPLSPLSKANAMRALGGGNRRGGASSASHLHRNMLDKALHKKARGMDPLRPGPTYVVPGAAH